MLTLPHDLPVLLKVTAEDLANTPEPVLRLLAYMIDELAKCQKRIDELEARLGMNSSNSNKTPSPNSPLAFAKDKAKVKAHPGAKGGSLNIGKRC